MSDNLVQTYGDVLVNTFDRLFVGVSVFVPKLVVALVVFFVGIFVAVTVGRVISQAVNSLKVDHVLRNMGLDAYVERAGWHLNSGDFLGGLVRWFFVLVFMLAAFDVLGLDAVTRFLNDVLAYAPQVIVAALVLLAGAVVGDVSQHVVSGAARAGRMPSAGFLGAVAKWAIWIFALFAALLQLGLFEELIMTVVQALVYMLALAGGLAFGLGGKEHASAFIDKMKREMSSHN